MCLHVAESGGDEFAVLGCYHMKVRCLFKFTAPAVAAPYSLHAASVMVESPALRRRGYLCGAGKGGSIALWSPCISAHILAGSSGWDVRVGKSWSAFLPLCRLSLRAWRCACGPPPCPSLPRNPLSVFSLIDSQSYWCATRATTPKPSSYFRTF